MDRKPIYVPINCSFYDYLEEAATLRASSIIEHSENDSIIKVESKINTLFIEDKVEYMKLENGQSIRLDNLISFNGRPLPKSC